MKIYILLFTLFFSFLLYSIIVLSCTTGYIGTQCCDEYGEAEVCVEDIDWGYCGGNLTFPNPKQPTNCTDFWSDICCCNGITALGCIVPPSEGERNLTGSCGRNNATIKCNGVDNRYVCNNTYYPSASKCAFMQPTINDYSVPTNVVIGNSFSVNVSGSCPSDLPGKCLIECRVVHPDGHIIELDTWSTDNLVISPSINCTQVGDYVVDYCIVYTDFYANSGWGSIDNTNRTVKCTPTPESKSPTYSNDGDNSNIYGSGVPIGSQVKTYAKWSDDTELSRAVFRHNASGWANVSWGSFAGSSWFNITYTAQFGDAGKKICWNQWANDTFNNWNKTMPDHCFNVVCSGTNALNCSVPDLEDPINDKRLWVNMSCDRANAKIDCNGIFGNHSICNPNRCVYIEPTINDYSVPTNVVIGNSFSVNVSGSCPSDLPGKCLIECRVIDPDGHIIELDTWDDDGSSTLPNVTCNKVGIYTVDYCVVKNDFFSNNGWGDVNNTNTSISCASTPECRDGIDNDDDNLIDYNSDPDCNLDPNDETEYGGCGNNIRELTEECDLDDDSACPDKCQLGCTCFSDDIAPTFSYDDDNSEGSVNKGTLVKIFVHWQDSTSNLGVTEFYHNMSGIMTLVDTCSFSSQSGWCNKTIDTKDFSGVICWDQKANDTLNNLNNSMYEHCFTVVSSVGATSPSDIESIFESIRRSVSTSTSEFSVNLLVLAFQAMGIIILIILIIILVQQLAQRA